MKEKVGVYKISCGLIINCPDSDWNIWASGFIAGLEAEGEEINQAAPEPSPLRLFIDSRSVNSSQRIRWVDATFYFLPRLPVSLPAPLGRIKTPTVLVSTPSTWAILKAPERWLLSSLTTAPTAAAVIQFALAPRWFEMVQTRRGWCNTKSQTLFRYQIRGPVNKHFSFVTLAIFRPRASDSPCVNKKTKKTLCNNSPALGFSGIKQILVHLWTFFKIASDPQNNVIKMKRFFEGRTLVRAENMRLN